MDDFAGLGGGTFGLLTPITGGKSLWIGARANALDVNLYGYSTISAENDVDMMALGVALTWSASPAQLIRKGRATEGSP